MFILKVNEDGMWDNKHTYSAACVPFLIPHNVTYNELFITGVVAMLRCSPLAVIGREHPIKAEHDIHPIYTVYHAPLPMLQSYPLRVLTTSSETDEYRSQYENLSIHLSAYSKDMRDHIILRHKLTTTGLPNTKIKTNIELSDITEFLQKNAHKCSKASVLFEDNHPLKPYYNGLPVVQTLIQGDPAHLITLIPYLCNWIYTFVANEVITFTNEFTENANKSKSVDE